MKLPASNLSNRIVLGGPGTYANRRQLRELGAFWESKYKQWTISKTLWDEIKHKFVGVWKLEYPPKSGESK